MWISFALSSWPFSSILFNTVLFFSLAASSYAQQTFFPASVPLAVRSTYFSAWESTVTTSVYSRTWPTLPLSPDSNGVLGWTGLARIDGITYSWLGDAQDVLTSNVTNVNITATRTTFTLEAGPLELVVTFLSPIEVRGES